MQQVCDTSALPKIKGRGNLKDFKAYQDIAAFIDTSIDISI